MKMQRRTRMAPEPASLPLLIALFALLGAGRAEAQGAGGAAHAAGVGAVKTTTAAVSGEHSPMLESVLPAVVTVAVVPDDVGASPLLAFERKSLRKSEGAAAQAYARPLDLSLYGGSGSGFVIERGGRPYVVTNAHVVEGVKLDSIFVYSVSRTPYRMRLVGADSYRDVAVLAFETAPGAELGTVPIHAAEIRIGTPVFAIGNPLGEFPYTITSGVVGGLNRAFFGDFEFTGREGYLQHDATIIWGNSGGPLVGPEGSVVGINTRIHIEPRLGNNPAPQINFALEGRHLARIVDDLVRIGYVERAYLGLVVAQPIARLPGATPVIIDAAVPGSPAAALDKMVGARVVSINGVAIENLYDARAVLENARPNAPLRLAVEHKGERQEIELTPTALDAARAGELGRYVVRRWLGAQLAPGTAALPPTFSAVASALPSNADLYLYQNGFQQVEPAPQYMPKAGDAVLYAGFYYPEGSRFWPTRSLEDVGVIARVTLHTGWLAIGYGDGQTLRFADILVGAPTAIL